MARKNHKSSRNVTVTREVYALAAIASQRAALDQDPEAGYLAGKVFGSRRITRNMLKALRSQAV
jgi:hypothetical protein